MKILYVKNIIKSTEADNGKVDLKPKSEVFKQALLDAINNDFLVCINFKELNKVTIKFLENSIGEVYKEIGVDKYNQYIKFAALTNPLLRTKISLAIRNVANIK